MYIFLFEALVMDSAVPFGVDDCYLTVGAASEYDVGLHGWQSQGGIRHDVAFVPVETALGAYLPCVTDVVFVEVGDESLVDTVFV